MTDKATRITVVGAGIGGLACALALCQRGFDVTVLEQAEAITEVGAGIQVSPNGMRVIEALGLAEGLTARSVRARAVSLRDYRRGDEVLRLDLKALPEDQGYYFVHRADLIDILADAVRKAGARVRLLQHVDTIRPGAHPRIELATGERVETDLVIGADGLHSVLRPALNGAGTPFFTGQVAWRAVVPNVTAHPAHARVHMGPGRHLVSYPLRDGSQVNIVAVEERKGWVEEGWHVSDDPNNLKAAFAMFDAEVHRLLDEVTEVRIWGLFRHPVAQHWYGENCVLLGDAAHPTLPFLAQGANMALEDAWVLARCLEDFPARAEALRRYQKKRRERVVRVVDAASGNAWKYHLRGPARVLAHAGLRLAGAVAPGRMLHQFDWLYGFDVTG
ncbi:FAD-dependent oxidoreductase [Mesobacterium sp. TK19101]|uniref:FAD-dependent oxidoreductase n=1 Tax=Mesobacterium hydrothermale TaxID=3111907 RepID=A0ABU6HDR8_9RHOB|nr:FAD-dependent oxidoreductase [Mesobacterium sp. TK19101]MEC3860602.1 FAD-dependent oxidoreductase [Mesobacterium sp. TK19101]